MADGPQWYTPGVPLRPQRVSLSVQARYRTPGEERWHKGRTENISQTGVLIRGIRLFSAKMKVEIVMTVPAGILKDAAGELLFIGAVARLLPPLGSGGLPGLAVAFESYRPISPAEHA